MTERSSTEGLHILDDGHRLSLPAHQLERHEGDVPSAPPFLQVERAWLRLAYEDGTTSRPFFYDQVLRPALDAIVLAPYFRRAGRVWVVLRSCVRPPMWLRPAEQRQPGEGESWHLYGLPAGLVEPGERTEEGLRACAARELFEETGFEVELAQVERLGRSALPAPALLGEKHHFFCVEVDPSRVSSAPSDGPLERHGRVVALRLDHALSLVHEGRLEDEKTELGLRRLADRLGT